MKSNALTPARLAAMLKKVPEKRFSITGLAPQLLTPEGRVDIEKCLDRHGEIILAIEEVKKYISDCHRAHYDMESIHNGKTIEDQWDEEREVEEEDGL